MEINFKPLIIAHRGSSSIAPENTMSSFKEAYFHGAETIELDVHRTKDNKLVIMHDDSVDRTTCGEGAIKDMSIDDLKKLDSGTWFGAKFMGEKIPTLEDVLKWAKGRVNIDIEIKNSLQYPGIEKDIIDLVKNKKSENNIIITSFDPVCVEKVKEIAPEIKTGLLLSPEPMLKALKIGTTGGIILGVGAGILAGLSTIATGGLALAGGAVGLLSSIIIGKKLSLPKIFKKEADVLIPFWAMIDKNWVKKAKQANKGVYVYTANNPKLVDDLTRNYQVDGIITDTPERFTKSHDGLERYIDCLPKIDGIVNATKEGNIIAVKAASPEIKSILEDILSSKAFGYEIKFISETNEGKIISNSKNNAEFTGKYGKYLLILPGVFGIAPDLKQGKYIIYVEQEEEKEFLSKILNPSVGGREIGFKVTRKITA